MGRKVHPLGFRLGINQDWQSRWFSERNYTEQVQEDIKLRAMVGKRLPNASISRVIIERSAANQIEVTLFTAKPGIVIGKGGQAVEVLRKDLEDASGKKVKLNIAEIKQPELDAYLVAESIADQITRRVSHKRAMKQAVQRAMRLGAKGIRIKCAGRLAGAEMARVVQERDGRVPLHTIRADIDYGQVHAHTTYGRVGVKVWIYRGEVIPGRDSTDEFSRGGDGQGRDGGRDRRAPRPQQGGGEGQPRAEGQGPQGQAPQQGSGQQRPPQQQGGGEFRGPRPQGGPGQGQQSGGQPRPQGDRGPRPQIQGPQGPQQIGQANAQAAAPAQPAAPAPQPQAAAPAILSDVQPAPVTQPTAFVAETMAPVSEAETTAPVAEAAAPQAEATAQPEAQASAPEAAAPAAQPEAASDAPAEASAPASAAESAVSGEEERPAGIVGMIQQAAGAVADTVGQLNIPERVGDGLGTLREAVAPQAEARVTETATPEAAAPAAQPEAQVATTEVEAPAAAPQAEAPAQPEAQASAPEAAAPAAQPEAASEAPAEASAPAAAEASTESSKEERPGGILGMIQQAAGTVADTVSQLHIPERVGEGLGNVREGVAGILNRDDDKAEGSSAEAETETAQPTAEADSSATAQREDGEQSGEES